jgi:hypothetical protein
MPSSFLLLLLTRHTFAGIMDGEDSEFEFDGGVELNLAVLKEINDGGNTQLKLY